MQRHIQPLLIPPSYSCSVRSRSKIRLIVWRCLGGDFLSCFENFMNDRQELIELGLGPRLTLPIAGRLGVGEDFLQGFPVQVVFLTDRPLAFLLGQHQATDFGPEMHVLVHSCFSRFVGLVTDLPLQVLPTNPR